MEISGQVDRASDIINHMRAFGRKSDLALLDTDINGVVAQACDLFGRQLVVHGITLETSLAPALPPVLAIPNRLEQVIVNLILNARDAVEERVKSAPEPPAVIGVSTAMDGNTVLLSVWDTGTGISRPPAEIKFSSRSSPPSPSARGPASAFPSFTGWSRISAAPSPPGTATKAGRSSKSGSPSPGAGSRPERARRREPGPEAFPARNRNRFLEARILHGHFRSRFAR